MMDAKLQAILEEFMEGLAMILREAQGEIPEQTEETSFSLSKRTIVELATHEGAVLEAYKDSVGVWTWGVGVTSRSGHNVNRYKDNPQTLERVLEVYEWLLRTKYLPTVLETFKGHDLNENQLAAALSFHYNTGAIGRASWVKSFKRGQISKAKREIMNWTTPKEITARRRAERDLFFDGKWHNKDGKINVYTRVRKPSYTPDWSSAKRIKYKG